MRATQFILFVVLVVGISAADLSNPVPCQNDNGASGPSGYGTCNSRFTSAGIRRVTYETAIESISSTTTIRTFQQLAHHVIRYSTQALGYHAVLSDSTLAEIAWIFRLRHMPDPVIFAAKTTLGDAKRTVRYVLTQESVRNMHNFHECDIKALIAAVEESTKSPTGFIFRMIPGSDNEYGQIATTQLSQRMHFFAAIHHETHLEVVFVGSEILGEFIKGHGSITAIEEREQASTFLKQWLLNQWINLWICTNPTTLN